MGLKREVAFLKTQPESSSSLGRTRSRKLEQKQNGLTESSRKKKKLKSQNLQNVLSQESSLGERTEPLSFSGKDQTVKGVSCEIVPKDEGRRRFTRSALKLRQGVDEMVGVYKRARRVSKLQFGEPSEVHNGSLQKPEFAHLDLGVMVDVCEKNEGEFMREDEGNVDDNGGAKNAVLDLQVMAEFKKNNEGKSSKKYNKDASVEKANKRFTRSALKPMVENKVAERSEVQNNVLSEPQLGDAGFEVMVEFDKTNKGKCTEKDEANVGIQSMIVDGNEGVKNASPQKLQRRFMRFVLKPMAEDMVAERSRVLNDSLAKPQSVHSRTQTMAQSLKNCNQLFCRKDVEDSDEGVKNTSSETPERLVSCSGLKASFVPKEVPTVSAYKMEAIGINSNKMAQNCSTEKARDLKGEIQLVEGNVCNAPKEKFLKRFTRSSLGAKSAPLVIPLSDIPCGGSTSTLSEDGWENGSIADSHKRTTEFVRQTRTPPKKKLEMKMSKKIALTNPSKVRELLQTGMLEGVPVKYMFGGHKREGLEGIIKDCGILCSCGLCKGCKVVKPFQFEQHAGGTDKNHGRYIYLDNGKSLLDVLNACKDAPLDTLKATIQREISSLPVDNVICLTCKRSLPFAWSMRRNPVCNTCVESKKVQASPSCSDSAASRSTLRTGTRKSSRSALKNNSEQTKSSSVSKLRSSINMSNHSSPQNQSRQGKLTRKDLGLHKLVFEDIGLPDGTELAYYANGEKLLEGYKKGFGIVCSCCNTEFSPSAFEAHAGHPQRRKPYLHIYTSNGVSLHELSLSLSKHRTFSAKDNDDLCGICADFGDLLPCHGCPRAFHRDCVGELDVNANKENPVGGLEETAGNNWYCPYCQNMFEREKFCAHNANAKAAGRVLGVDPIEQICRRCIRIVNTPEGEGGGCTLCRCHDFSTSGFGPRTIIICDQCEREFHVGCLKDQNMDDLKELPEDKWFCTKGCRNIHYILQKLIANGPETLPDSISKVVKKSAEENSSSSDLGISWRFLCGKTASPESRSLLSKAVAMFHDCFAPIVDSVSGRDLIPIMVYGKNIRIQEFGGMFCAVLMVNSCVVSAGILRVFGQELAELPLVATNNGYQRKGYFQSLFSCIERLLAFMKVKNLVLPAAHEAEAIWTKRFGFQKMSHDQVTNYRRDYQLTSFLGTSMLQKRVPACRIIRRPS